METDVITPQTEPKTTLDTSGIGGHPAGLTTLFFTEMWERFSYYGMRALLMYFMTDPLSSGALGFDTKKAGHIYGLYTGSVYLTAIPGGWIADKLLGARRTVLVGAIVIALGHFSIAFNSLPSFYSGLVLIVIGVGLLKPNISAMVGDLYSEGDARRDAGFSVFYMGINIGAFLAPIVCSFLARRPEFKTLLASLGLQVESTWHWGFAAAGVGMTFGLVQYVYPKALRILLIFLGAFMGGLTLVSFKPNVAALTSSGDIGWLALAIILGGCAGLAVSWYVMKKAKGSDAAESVHPLANVGLRPPKRAVSSAIQPKQKLTAEEKKRLMVIGILFVFSAVFWMAFEQAGSSLALFADRVTRHSIFGWEFDAGYFQSVNSLFIIGFAPVFSILWLRMKDKEPSSPIKFSLGLVFAGLGFIVLAFASTLGGDGARVSPMWLMLVFLLHTIGELCLSPVGLSTVTKLAPARLAGLMMGVWFLSLAVGNYAGGWVAGFFDATVEGALVRLFGYVALTTLAAGGILVLLAPSIKRLMGRVN